MLKGYIVRGRLGTPGLWNTGCKRLVSHMLSSDFAFSKTLNLPHKQLWRTFVFSNAEVCYSNVLFKKLFPGHLDHIFPTSSEQRIVQNWVNGHHFALDKFLVTHIVCHEFANFRSGQNRPLEKTCHTLRKLNSKNWSR